MDENQLERILQSIGKKCFVKYFNTFNDKKLSNEDVIEILMKNEGYEESGSRTRVTQARRIIKEEMLKKCINNYFKIIKIRWFNYRKSNIDLK